MAGFMQIVELQTTRIDELRTIADETNEASSGDAPSRRTVTADRNRPDHYFMIVEFDSDESAMKASASPETSQFALRMAELCDAPPTTYDLAVIDTWNSKAARKLAAQAKAKKIASQAKTLAAGAAAATVGVVAAAKAARKQSDDASGGDDVVEIDYTEPPAAHVTETLSTSTDEPGRVHISPERRWTLPMTRVARCSCSAPPFLGPLS